MDPQEQFNHILASLYEAMIDDSLWPDVAGQIDEAVGMKGGHLVVAEGGDFLYQQLTYRGERREELERWFVENASRDPRIPRLYDLPHGRLTPVRDLYTDQELRTSFGFNELLALGEAQNGLNVKVDSVSGPNLLWVLADPTSSGEWRSDQLAMLEGLLPHVCQFVRVRQAIANAQAMGATLSGLLDHKGVGVLQLDRRGRIIAANAPADAILCQADALAVHDRHLAARRKADNTRLDKLLAAALPKHGSQAVSSSMVIRGPDERRWALHILPVAPQNGASGLASVAALVLVVDPAMPRRLDRGHVAASLGLTRTEADVAAAIAEGLSVREIVSATHRTESTVRWNIKQVRSKLGVPRQADVVRMVLSAVGGM